jgi:hypothetical protein
MNRITAEQACQALEGGRTVGNRQWPGHRSISAQDLHAVTPAVLRSLVEPAGADDWYLVPGPVTLTGDGSPERPYAVVDSEREGQV